MLLKKMRIKRDDIVRVIAGKEKGKEGKVLGVFPENNRVIVEKLNIVKRHTRQSQNKSGGIIEKEAKIEISNVMLVCVRCGKLTRVSRKILEDGKKVRVCKQCKEVIDQ